MSIHVSPYRHILESQQFDKRFIEEVHDGTSVMKHRIRAAKADGGERTELEKVLAGKWVAILFYEPSTRTTSSFRIAAECLGGKVLWTESAKTFSSASKGESLEHTVRMLNGYLMDFIVLRHYENDSSIRAAAVSTVPIINAGSGTGQHPTQALLDLYTIKEKLGRLYGLDICLAGDLSYGRTVKSLAYLMAGYPGNTFHLVSHDQFRMPSGIKEHLDAAGCKYYEYDSLDCVLAKADVVYMTRTQVERLKDEIPEEEFRRIAAHIRRTVVINGKNIELMRPDAILMHPLPINRRDKDLCEISEEVDSNPRTAYFDQAANGLPLRAALFELLNKHNYR